MRTLVAAASILGAATLAPAMASALAFTGTTMNVNPVMEPPGRCAPARTVSIGGSFGPATGTSNLGSFTYTASHCINGKPPGPYVNGIFDFTLASGDLLGTYSGVLTATITPGVFDNVQNYIVTGGTGRFEDAAGAFTGMGTVTIANGFATQLQTFQGALSGVPEPGAWSMMLIGVVLAGSALRRRIAAHKRNEGNRERHWRRTAL